MCVFPNAEPTLLLPQVPRLIDFGNPISNRTPLNGPPHNFLLLRPLYENLHSSPGRPRITYTSSASPTKPGEVCVSLVGLLHVADLAREMLSDAYSTKYSESLVSIYRRYNSFRDAALSLLLSHPSHYEMAIYFVQHQLWQSTIELPSALQYTVELTTALKLWEGVDPDTSPARHLWRLYQRALRRAGALVPKHQAPAMQLTELEQILEDGTLTMRMRLAILVAWLTSARGSDLRVLFPKHVEKQPQGHFSVLFTGGKTDPFLLGQGTGMDLPGPWEKVLCDLIVRCSDTGEPLFPYRNDSITRVLRTANPSLSAHSIRRGSLQHLLLKGVPISKLTEFGRYKTVSGLLHYLPLAKLPSVLEAASTTQLLLTQF